MTTRDKVLAIFTAASAQINALNPRTEREAQMLLDELGCGYGEEPGNEAATVHFARYMFAYLVSEGQVALWDRLMKGE